ncbi:MAG: diacylglycerol kinase family lipid kinase [Acidobacteriota bacterium]|nr:diacylglycerol kinase family lipid kinase [Acidobacteriota bacterium]
MKTATLIYNPVAGRDPRRREQQIKDATAVLEEHGFRVKPARTKGPGCASGIAQEAVSSGADLVLACGGDGTVNEVVNGLTPSAVPLAILPGGTANIVANELRLPHNPVQAAHELVKWTPRRIALGKATGKPTIPACRDSGNVERYFISVAGLGFDAYVIHRLGIKFKMSFGVTAYVVEGLRQLMRYRFHPIYCQVDSQRYVATLALVQRTSLYAGWFKTAPYQSITVPRFSLSLFRSRRWFRYIAYGLAVVTQRQLHDVDRMEASNVSFAAADPGAEIFFELDGELAGVLPASIEIVPDALTLLMPDETNRTGRFD